MKYKDYYAILGVARDASADDIKRAYRRLARKYHPDVSKEANAEERFKEMQEAYEVLKDPEKRAAYDQLGAEWKSGQQFRPPPDWASGFEFGGGGARARDRPGGDEEAYAEEGFSDFFSSLFGGGSPFGAATRRGGRDHHARVEIPLEQAFQGTTRTLELKRPLLTHDGS